MSSIPSSSPVYTPIKRIKRIEIDDLEPVTLFSESPAEWHTAQTSDDLELPDNLDIAPATMSTPQNEPQIVPNSQWWEESPLPPVPSLDLGPDDTVDSDTDDDGGDGENTQFYLRQILTESMVESLPLPPQQKLKAKEIIHSSEKS